MTDSQLPCSAGSARQQCPHDMGSDRELGPLGCRLVGQGMECVCEHMHFTSAAQPTGMQPIADDLRAAAKAYRKGIYRDVSPDHLADTFDRIASSIEAAQPPAAPVETKPFYGAQCPTYPNCSGGCGLGCTHEVKQHQSCSAGNGGEE